VAKIICPGCGAEIDTDKEIAEFSVQPELPKLPPDDEEPAASSTVATSRRGNAFFKLRTRRNP